MVNVQALHPLSLASSRVLKRFAVPERHPAFWVVMWAAVVLAEFAGPTVTAAGG